MRCFLRLGTVSLVALGGMSTGMSTGCAAGPTRGGAGTSPTVTSQDFQNSNEPIEVVLQRKVPGLKVTKTSDGGIALNIRGATSFASGVSTAPLYILDGLPFSPGPEGAITGVNPNDIASVRVLKGAEAGIYGSAGSDGVIIITTKLGAGSTKENKKP